MEVGYVVNTQLTHVDAEVAELDEHHEDVPKAVAMEKREVKRPWLKWPVVMAHPLRPFDHFDGERTRQDQQCAESSPVARGGEQSRSYLGRECHLGMEVGMEVGMEGSGKVEWKVRGWRRDSSWQAEGKFRDN